MEWPPSASQVQYDRLTSIAIDHALAHSLVVRSPQDASSFPLTHSTVAAPFSLFPSPFPRHLFQLAYSLQPLYNKLYARVANDSHFLHQVIGGAVVAVDTFQASLWDIYLKVQKEAVVQPLQFGLFRSDYLLHSPQNSSPSNISLKQVEFNTISSSFGPLAARASQLHKYLYNSDAYPFHPNLSNDALPENIAISGLANGIAQAHKLYGNKDANVLMVVQPNESNAFDQRLLEFQLSSEHKVHVVRMSFEELGKSAELQGNGRKLVIINSSPLLQPKTTAATGNESDSKESTLQSIEISVVYYRAGYTPNDYHSQAIWDTRLLLERSKAIKCPSVGLQLAGAKKVQQVLSRPEMLERFLGNDHSKEDLDRIRQTFAALYPLDDSESGNMVLRLIEESNGEGYVLKPQREGGGNNIYGTAIPKALSEMEKVDKEKSDPNQIKEREGYILMELIEPPKSLHNILVKKNETKGVLAEIMSELGIYGVSIWNSNENDLIVNSTAGQLLRTKASDVLEGGVATGFSVIDSPLLW